MTKYRTAALALAGVLALGATTSASADWRGHRGHAWVPGVAAGVAAGALIGSAVAARPYGYYEPGYYHEAPVAGYYYDDTQSPPFYRYGYRYNCGGSYGQNRDCSFGDTGR